MTEAHLPIRDALTTYSDLARLVLAHGTVYDEWTDVPEPFYGHRHKEHDCYGNALFLSLESRDNPQEEIGPLWYVEGFAVHRKSVGEPVGHAWTITREGVVIDPTWLAPTRGGEPHQVAYMGVPLQLDWVKQTSFKRGQTGVLHLLDETTISEHMVHSVEFHYARGDADG